MTKKQGYILDHWGKGSPSAAETAVLDQEVEVLKQEMEEASQKKIPSTVDTNSLISKVFIVVFFIISLIPHFLEQKKKTYGVFKQVLDILSNIPKLMKGR